MVVVLLSERGDVLADKRGTRVFDLVGIEVSGLARVEAKWECLSEIPLLQHCIEVVDGLVDFSSCITIDRRETREAHIIQICASMTKLFNLLLTGMLTEHLACKMSDVIPHHNGLFTRSLMLLIVNRHFSGSWCERFHGAVK